MIFIIVLLLINSFSYGTYQVINHSGRYTLGDNVKFNPTATNEVAIRISASDVILDLNGYIIRQAAQNSLLSIHGIMVDSNMQNVTIKNGMVSQLTGTGILINEGCSRITLENLQTFSCDLVGIECLGTITNPITEMIIDNCQTYSCCVLSRTSFVSAAVHLKGCYNSTMSNCIINDNINALSLGFAILYIDDSHYCVFKNIQIINNICGGIYAGFANISSTDCLFDQCLALKNSAMSPSSNLGIGFLAAFPSTARLTFQNCIAQQNSGAQDAYGFFMDNSPDIGNILFKDCVSLQNTGSNSSAGYLITSNGNNAVNCIAQANAVDLIVGSTSYGFYVINATNCSLIDCKATNQSGVVAAGFEVDSCISCELRNCQAYNNVGLSDNFSFGLRINGDSGIPDTGGNIFVNNIASHNGIIDINQMSNFPLGTATNINFGSLNSVLTPFTNLGLVP